MNEYNFSNAFSHPLNIYFYCQYVVILTDSYILNYLCILGINSNWMQYLPFLKYSWILFAVF